MKKFWVTLILFILLGLIIMFVSGSFYLFLILILLGLIFSVFTQKYGAEAKVETGAAKGVSEVGKALGKLFGKIGLGGRGRTILLILRGIGIGSFIGLIGYFAVFAYQGYNLGSFGSAGLILVVITGLILIGLFLKFLSAKGLPPLTVLLIIILIVSSIYGIYYMNKVGFLKRGVVKFEKIQILDRIKTTYYSAKERLTEYIYGYGKWTAPETVEEKKPVGVKFESFMPRRTYFRSGKDDISVISTVKVYGIPDRDINVKFDCDMEGIKPKDITVSGSFGKDIIRIPRKQEFGIHQVICTFDPVEEVPKEGEVIVKKVDLTAKYENFATISKLRVYTMDEDELQRIEYAGDNPFKVYEIEDPLVTEERTTIPVQDINSPVELWLNLPLMQPLTDGDSFYTLGFKLKHNKVAWGGTVDVIREINFAEFPDKFSVMQNSKLSYAQEHLVKINEKLSEGKELSSDTEYIDFLVTETPEEGLSYDVIKAIMEYDYIFKDSTIVEIVEEKGF